MTIVISFFIEIQISKWDHLKKVLFLTYFSLCLFTRDKNSLTTYTYFAHPIDYFSLPNFAKKIQIHHVWFLLGMTPDVDSYSRHFGVINKQQSSEQTLSWNVCTTDIPLYLC